MTDKEFAKQKKRVFDMWTKLGTVLGLGWFHVELFYERGLCEQTPETYAYVNADWQYRQAWVYFFLPKIAEVTDDKLQNTLLHEMCHILLASTQPKPADMSDAEREREEYATENVARAIEWAMRYGSGEQPQAESAKIKPQSKAKEK